MNHGKYAKTSKNRKRRAVSQKTIVLLASLALVLACIVGTTVAYLLTNTGSVTNTFTPARVTSDIEETFEKEVKTNVKVANTGNVPAYIRAAIIVTWKDEKNGNVYGVAPVDGTDYEITLNLKDQYGNDIWTQGSDGYYYCNKVIPVGESTPVLITSCKPVAGKTPEGYGLNVEILGSAIQADGMGATSAQDAWAKAAASN